MREKEAREVFEKGFHPMLERLQPKRIVVYGSRKSQVFELAEHSGIEVIQFDTETSKAFAKAVA